MACSRHLADEIREREQFTAELNELQTMRAALARLTRERDTATALAIHSGEDYQRDTDDLLRRLDEAVEALVSLLRWHGDCDCTAHRRAREVVEKNR